MNQYYFNIIKYGPWFPRVKITTKNIIVHALSYEDAKRILSRMFSDWEVSMYWPVDKSFKPHPKISYLHLS